MPNGYGYKTRIPVHMFRTRTCIVCGKPIYGQKPVGSLDIYNRKHRKIGTAHYYKGKQGYAHLECRKRTMARR